ncbi:MAG TPA: aldo/keto reductase, partial [Polyangiaceae bacterium]
MNIATQPFGRTGHQSTKTIFGAAALAAVSQAETDRTLELLLEYGVNHIDTAAGYGESERLLGAALGRYPGCFFLATKTGERTYAKARDEIRCSLERLRVDRVDLLQLHCLVNEAEWQTAMGPQGALEALVEAREQGLTRFVGVTGHEAVAPKMHLRSLERFDFDSVLLPYNFVMMQNAEYASAFEALHGLCRERNVAVQTMKSICRGPWGDVAQTRATWYRPLEAEADILRAVHWVLSRPGVFLNTVGDIHILPKVLAAAADYRV